MAFHDIIQILASVPDVWNVTSFDDSTFYLWKIIPLVEAYVLGIIEDWQWSFDYNAVKSLFQ